MEPVVEKKSESKSVELSLVDAEAMSKLLATVEPKIATETFSIMLSLYEQGGNAFISWKISPNCAITDRTLLQLVKSAANGAYFTCAIEAHSDVLDTKCLWGPGLYASLVASSHTDHGTKYMVIAKTPDT
ncbi:MAG TPA: hypothetical protein VKK31_16520 [Thermoanaerobaculia bacterium]|nr:hypothetical protein [Thermoanaerobaculia bacterium]